MDTATPRDAARPTFRDATGDDVPALVALVESAYRGDSSRAGWTTEADILQGQRTMSRGCARSSTLREAGCSPSSATTS
ncbi:hypothetical protein SCYAM73S_02865 [Streptomyces cyaneofuscatus]